MKQTGCWAHKGWQDCLGHLRTSLPSGAGASADFSVCLSIPGYLPRTRIPWHQLLLQGSALHISQEMVSAPKMTGPAVCALTYRHQGNASQGCAGLACAGLAVRVPPGFAPAQLTASGQPPGQARPRSGRTCLDVSRLLRDAEGFASALPLLLRSG